MAELVERELTEKEQEEAMAEWVEHYESKLPRPENYKRKSVPHLRKLQGELREYCEGFRKALSRFPNDRMAADLLRMYETHLRVAEDTLLKKAAKAA